MANKYDQIHQDLMDLVLSGDLHATMIGTIITLGGSEKSDLREAEILVEYIVDLLKKAETRRKDNVKKSK